MQRTIERYVLVVVAGAYGKGKFMAGIKPAAYRVHPGGVFSMRSDKRKLHMNLQTCSSLANYYNRLGNQPLYQYFLMQTVCLSLAALAPATNCRRCGKWRST